MNNRLCTFCVYTIHIYVCERESLYRREHQLDGRALGVFASVFLLLLLCPCAMAQSVIHIYNARNTNIMCKMLRGYCYTHTQNTFCTVRCAIARMCGGCVDVRACVYQSC